MLEYEIIPVTNFLQNCTLVWCSETKEAVVIDPGGDIEKIVEAIEKSNVELKKILLTHAHLDHVGASTSLASKFNVEIEGPHEDDQFWLNILPQQSSLFGLSEIKSFSPKRWLSDGDRITVGNLVLNVLHCPGHTPGHIIFYNEEEKWAQVGDVLFAGSIGRTDFPKGDHQTLIASIKGKLFKLSNDITFIPGHGNISTLGHEKKTNPYLN